MIKTQSREFPSHLDEYKALRDEIVLKLRDIHQTEVFGAVCVGMVYSWLVLHKREVQLPPAVWGIGPGVVFLCGVRCAIYSLEIFRISRYLQRIEKVAFNDDAELPGWEHYIEHSAPNRGFHLVQKFSAVIVWALAFITTCFASWGLSS